MKVINKISNKRQVVVKRKMHVSGSTALMGSSWNCKDPLNVTGSIPVCRYKCNLFPAQQPPAAGSSPAPASVPGQRHQGDVCRAAN